MAITTYAELCSAVADYATRSDYTTVIPTFITLAETMFNYGDAPMEIEPLRIREMETTVSAVPVSGDLTLETDILEIRRVTYQSNPRRILEYAAPDWLDSAYGVTEAGDPSFYTIVNGTLSIRPTGTSAVQYIYYKKIPALTASNTTNWLLTKSPNVYLFGTLYQLEIYSKNAEGAVSYGTLMKNALAGLINSDKFSRASSYARRASSPTW